jgi:hypothetical protein
MSDEKKDYTKLRSFVEAAITNPKHPVFALGMSKSSALQHYALNVRSKAFTGGLAVMESDQWFKDYPAWTAQLEEVMKLCEEDETAAKAEGVTESSRIASLEQTVADLTAKIADLTKKPETTEA